MNKIIQIKKDFQLKNIKDSVHLKFLDKVSKSPVYVSKKTGLVYHPDILSSEKAVERWSKKIYSKKNNPKNELYTSDFPGMQSRHYFVIDFFRRFIKINKKLPFVILLVEREVCYSNLISILTLKIYLALSTH